MPIKEQAPLQKASDQEINDLLERFQPVEDPDDLPGEITRVKKVPGLEKLRDEPVQELSESDLEEVEDEFELSEDDLEEMPKAKNGTLRRAEYRVVESREKGSDLKYGLAKEASPEHPDRNEDAAFYSAKRGIQMVADGMGGVPAGDYASAKAAEQLTRVGLEKADPEVRKTLEANREEVLDQKDVEKAVDAIIRQMNDEIVSFNATSPVVHEKAKEYFEKEMGSYDSEDARQKKVMDSLLKSIGCTISMSKIWRDEKGKDNLTIGNVGDSRTYILRKGNLEKISRDDSHVQILIDEGLIKNDEDVLQQIDKSTIIAMADKHPELRSLVPKLVQQADRYVTIDSIRNRITQAVGVADMMKAQYGIDFKPFVKTIELEDGDLILTATDGIADNLTDSEIQAILLLNSDNPLKAAQELQQTATERSIKGKKGNPRAKLDDVTALTTLYKKT